MAEGRITSIDKQSVHQICSGQVILSLAVAVKELVENGLDAGASRIEVRLRDYGGDCVEVADNGCGIEPSNFAALAKKHHTSKLREFEDLSSVGTFGFRGEALSSLCALSDLSLVTRNLSQEVGTRIKYDANGVVTATTHVAREPGTTVCLQRLFHTLPVRHIEFQKHLKKEFTRMVTVLQGYCIVSTGIRISCHNQTANGKKQLILTTNGNPTVKENLVNVFGAKQVQNMVALATCDVDDVRRLGEEFAGVSESAVNLFRLSGYICRCNHGYGRSSTDRQFIFLNKRPCDHTKLFRVVNETYHAYNRHQYPCVALCIDVDQASIDVNVTPDKRQMIIQHEKTLLAIVKATILKTFEPMAGLFDLKATQGTGQFGTGLSSQNVSGMGLEREASESEAESGSDCPASQLSCLSQLSGLKRSFGHSSAAGTAAVITAEETREKAHGRAEPEAKQRKLFDCGFATQVSSEIEDSATDNCSNTSVYSDLISDNTDNTFDNSDNIAGSCGTSVAGGTPSNRTDNCDRTSESRERRTDNSGNTFDHSHRTSSETPIPIDLMHTSGEETPTQKQIAVGNRSPHRTASRPDTGACSEPRNHCPLTQEVAVDWEATRRRVLSGHAHPSPFPRLKRRQFKAAISPQASTQAEDELRREVTKEMFREMQVIGQFNLGFIIAKAGSSLFIVDQHASDEKYNFECLRRDTVLQHQKLISPLNLELTAVQEMVVMENLNIFSANGFEFQIDQEGPPTERVKLIGLPVSKNWQFGSEDVSELIFLLSDSPGEMCRPSRVAAMFASRACRTSIMIGTALSKRKMKRLLEHMSTMDHPWNCPHGRPTMRHLVDLCMLSITSCPEGDKNEEEEEEDGEAKNESEVQEKVENADEEVGEKNEEEEDKTRMMTKLLNQGAFCS